MKKSNILAFGVGLMMAVSSCSVPQNVTYLQDTSDSSVIQLAQLRQIKVQPEDKLNIIVKCKDPQISDLFNLPVSATRIGTSGTVNGNGTTMRTYTGSSTEGIAAYTVDPAGNIDFPVLGQLHIAGMTRSEVAAFIKGELMGRDLVKDPTVIVEFLSTGINVLGEVSRPGRYDLNRDHISLLEALSLAGDLTITGQRENVKVLREEDGQLKTYTIDLTNANSLAKSPAYYLQQGDIVYVEPNNMRKRATTVNGNNALSVSFWVSVASLLTSVVTTIAVFVNK